MRREAGTSAERADALVALASEQGYPTWLALGLLMRGWAQVDQGWVGPGIAQMHQGVAAMRSTGFRMGWPYYLALLAKACARLGEVEEAHGLQAEAVRAGHETGEHCWDAELCRLEGALLLEQRAPDPARAEACFRRAIDAARRAHTRSWELRAATSLGRLLRERDRRDEARSVLAGAYTSFTEGFETADLRDARALLDALGEAQGGSQNPKWSR